MSKLIYSITSLLALLDLSVNCLRCYEYDSSSSQGCRDIFFSSSNIPICEPMTPPVLMTRVKPACLVYDFYFFIFNF